MSKKAVSFFVIILGFIFIFSSCVFSHRGIKTDNVISSTSAVTSENVALNESECAQKVKNCIISIRNSGADDSSVAEANKIVDELHKSTQPFAAKLSELLKNIVSSTGEDKAIAVLSVSRENIDISDDLIYQAASACYLKNSRSSSEIMLTFAGDCTFGTINSVDSETSFPTIYRKSKSISFPFDNIKPWLINDDLSVINFEGTLTNATATADKQWKFKGESSYANILPSSSVEIADLANNHSFDYLQQGLEDTVKNFKATNTGLVQKNQPFITNVKGVEVVIIGDCSVVGENTTVITGVAERVLSQIEKYKKPNNIVIVDMHWGGEYDKVPTDWQQTTGRKFIDAGADLVVGQHPHIVQGIEQYKGKYIVYSLGNFSFGGNRLAQTPETFVFRIGFSVKDLSITRAGVVPCYVSSSSEKNSRGVLRNNYQPIPVFGGAADNINGIVIERSKKLKYGIQNIEY